MMNKYRLMSPGPTPIPPEVSAAGALPIIHHRTPEFGEVFTRVNENLKRVFLTENDIFTYAASGTGAFEGAIQNLFSPGDKVLVVNNGNFGGRWVKMSRAFGLEVTELDMVGREGGQRRDRRSAGERSWDQSRNLRALGDLDGHRQRHRRLRQGSAERRHDRGWSRSGACAADRRVGSRRSRRWLAEGAHDATWPGVRERQRAGHADARRVADAALLLRLDGGQEGLPEGPGPDGVDPGGKPHHPARRRVAAALGRGHRERLRAARNARSGLEGGIKGMGLELFGPDEDPNSAVTAAWVPEGIDGKQLVRMVFREHGIQVAGGQGEMAGRIFRIGHCGYFDAFDIIATIAATELALESLDYPSAWGASALPRGSSRRVG